MCSILKIDTKGTCLLCYSSRDGSGFNGHHDLESTTAFKMLLRYLKIDLRKHLFSTCIQQFITSSPLESINLSVSLCEDCSAVVKDFLEIFQSLEGARLQLDLCIRQLHEFMEKGTHDSERVQDYAKLMDTGNVGDLIGSSIADNLRQETLEKVSTKVNSSVPRISLKDITLSANHTKVIGLDKKSRNKKTEVSSHPNLLRSSEARILSKSATEDPELILLSSDDEEFKEMEFVHDAVQSVETPIVEKDKPKPVSSTCSNEVNCLLPPTHVEDTAIFDITHGEKSEKTEDSSHSILLPNSATINAPEAEWRKESPEKAKLGLLSTQEEECMEVDVVFCGDDTPQSKGEINLPVFHKCMFCEKNFSQAYTLRTHQLSQHTFSILATDGALPLGISEKELETNLELQLGHIITETGQCSFCEHGEFQWKDLVRVHLVQEHLNRVIGNVEKLSGENAKVLGDDPKMSSSLSTIPIPVQENLHATLPTVTELQVLDIGIKATDREENSLAGPLQTLLIPSAEQPDEGTEQLETSVNPEADGTSFFNNLSTDPKIKKCVYCELQFTTSYMTTHFYNNHAWIILSNKGLLPPGLSEQQLERALADILKQLKTLLDKCPHCELNLGYFKRKCHVKRHLLDCHLAEVIEKAETIPVKPSPPKELNKNFQKCSLCGKFFNSSTNLGKHKLLKHTMTVLDGRIPSSVSEQDVNLAVKKMIANTRIIGRQKTSQAALYECRWCEKGIWGEMRFHLLKSHLDKIIEGIVENKTEPSPIQTPKDPPSPSPTKSKQTSEKKIISTSKSKYKCSLCPKQVTSLPGLKMHYARMHMGPQKQKAWKCEFCTKEFALLTNLRCHSFSTHPVATFSDRLPPTISDQAFNKAVSQILRGSSNTQKGNEGTVRYRRFQCPLCGRQVTKLGRIRLHIVRHHLDNVIETIGTIGSDIAENYGSAGPENQIVVKEEGADNDEIEPWKLLEVNLDSNVSVNAFLQENSNTGGGQFSV